MPYRNLWKKFLLIVWLALWTGPVVLQAVQLGGRKASEWIEILERPERVAGLKVDEIVARLELKPGLVIADIGAGTGLFSRPMARAVAPGGQVLAVDVDQELLDYIAQRAKQENLANLQPVLATLDNPSLPTHQVDMAFFHDVLHHIEHRETYLKNLASYMKPDGRIALVEMDKDDPQTPHRSAPEMLLSRETVDQWMAEIGFYPAQEFDLFPGKKWFVVYQRKAPPARGNM
ncbi:MAG: class I SAM-dependent methyltransferase [Acidobacteria bacterium]|nr:class I SAM-dependent methyltransferase [Acidobacteriota bacterium]